jgi:repressor LexA
MDELTPTQEKVLSFVIRHQKTKGTPPTVREIATAMGFKSINNARQHLQLIEKKGYIQHMPGKARGIHVVIGFEQPDPGHELRVPLIGRIAAGLPITAEENCEGYVTIDRELFRGDNLFTLRVQGDSMIGAGIHDGDIAIIRQQPTVQNGEIGVVIIEGGATLKRVIKHQDHVILRAENPAYGDMIFFSDTQLWIVGKLVGLMRKCS